MDELLRQLLAEGGTELYLNVGTPPLKNQGRTSQLLEMSPHQVLQTDEMQILIYNALSDEQIEEFETQHHLIFRYLAPGAVPFDAFILQEKLRGISAVFRAMKTSE